MKYALHFYSFFDFLKIIEKIKTTIFNEPNVNNILLTCVSDLFYLFKNIFDNFLILSLLNLFNLKTTRISKYVTFFHLCGFIPEFIKLFMNVINPEKINSCKQEDLEKIKNDALYLLIQNCLDKISFLSALGIVKHKTWFASLCALGSLFSSIMAMHKKLEEGVKNKP